jgi:hypothetical protein
MTCGSAQIVTYGGDFCITIGTTHATIGDGACMAIAPLPVSGQWSVTRPPFSSSAGCTAVPDTTVPPLTWEESHRGCGFGAPTTCGDDEVCVPERDAGQRLCVWVEGDATCPATFPERLDTAEDATDNRACGTCSCGSVSGMCGGAVSITNSCPGTLLYSRISVAACQDAESLPTPMHASGGFVPSATCPPSTPAPTGAATPTMPRTVCCATD